MYELNHRIASVWFIAVNSCFLPRSFYKLSGPWPPWVSAVSPGVLLALFLTHLSVVFCISGGCIWTATCCGHVLFPYKEVFVTYKSGYGGLHICIFTLCLILMAEFPLVLFCILHLFLSVCHVFPPPTFVLAVSRRQCSRQPKELEKKYRLKLSCK